MRTKSRPTVRDVAATAEVSVATVDRVLNRRAPVNEETARRVLEAARSVGFHGTVLVQKRLEERVAERTLGFLLQKGTENFYRNLGQELARATREASTIKGRPSIEFLTDLAPVNVGEALLRLADRSDAVAMVAADHPRITEAVEAVRARGTPVFTLLSDIAASARSGFLGIDHRKAGRTAAWAISRLARAPGRVAVLIGSHRYLGQELCEISFRSYFREHAPEFQLLDALMSLEDSRLAHETTLNLLGRVEDLRGIYVAGGGMEGVISGCREHGASKDIVVVCNELIPETRAALIDGVVDLVIATPVHLLADRTVEAMVRSLEARTGEILLPPPLPFELYTAENI